MRDFFFFQAEDGIRVGHVTGVQTCALPICIRDEVTTGQPLFVSIRGTDMFPTMLLQMVAIGEESGALDDMLDKVASHYEEAVDNMVDGLTALLEPIIMAVLGTLIGGLMIAMYLPIFMMGSVI